MANVLTALLTKNNNDKFLYLKDFYLLCVIMQITLLKYIKTNLLQNVRPIYYSDVTLCGDNSFYEIEDINEMYNQKYYIKLGSWGDYQIEIFSIEKPNLIMSNIFKNEFDENVMLVNNGNDNSNVKTLKQFINLFSKPIIFDENKNIIYDGNDKNVLKNIYYYDINPYKIIFNKIFNRHYHEIHGYKLLHVDGNFTTCAVEFDNAYYIINQNSS